MYVSQAFHCNFSCVPKPARNAHELGSWWRYLHTFFLVDETWMRKSSSDMGVSKNKGTPKSSILIGFFIINHPFFHYFHIIGDGHQPNSRGLYTHYKDSVIIRMTIPNIATFDHGTYGFSWFSENPYQRK